VLQHGLAEALDLVEGRRPPIGKRHVAADHPDGDRKDSPDPALGRAKEGPDSAQQDAESTKRREPDHKPPVARSVRTTYAGAPPNSCAHGPNAPISIPATATIPTQVKNADETPVSACAETPAEELALLLPSGRIGLPVITPPDVRFGLGRRTLGESDGVPVASTSRRRTRSSVLRLASSASRSILPSNAEATLSSSWSACWLPRACPSPCHNSESAGHCCLPANSSSARARRRATDTGGIPISAPVSLVVSSATSATVRPPHHARIR
jgi:hypothetical protein